MLATTVAPARSSPGSTWSRQCGTPGPCSPTALSIPDGVGRSRGAGLPLHSNAASDLTTTAPSSARSNDPASSVPYPAVPDAVITPLRSVTDPTLTSPARFPQGFASRATKSLVEIVEFRHHAVPWCSWRLRTLSGWPICSRRPCTAARAALIVVTQATLWRIDALRIASPSDRPPRPCGVLTTNVTLPEPIRSTAVLRSGPCGSSRRDPSARVSKTLATISSTGWSKRAR